MLRSRLRMWRTRARTMTFNVTLFLLGILSCLLCLQINSSRFLTDGINCNNLFGSGETSFYIDAIAQARAQVECNCPCDVRSNNNIITNNNNNNNNNNNGVIGGSNTNNNNNDNNNYYEEVISEHVVSVGKKLGRNTTGGGGGIGIGNGRKNRKISSPLNSTSVTMSSNYDRDHEKDNNEQQGYSGGSGVDGLSSSPTVWIITPTFYRPEQKPELTRLAQALLPVSHFIHWVVVDDVSQGSETSLRDLQTFLERFPLTFTLLKSLGKSEKLKVVGKPRGVGGRRAAIAWLRHNAQDGVVYFADDDNTYDSDIFRQMQHTKKVSMWPVGLVTELGVSSPIVKNGRVVGFYDGWNGLRKFPVDMAGFAINMELFHSKPSANMPWVAGYEEDELLRSLEIKVQDIIPLANECTEILVWHTKAVRNSWPKRPRNLKPQILTNTNLNKLLVQLPQQSLAGPESSTKMIKAEDNKFSFIKFFFGSL